MSVKLIWVTPDAEKIIGYCARVSNPANQNNPDITKLLKYCIKHGHWSVFETANMCVEIETSRAISAQILRHRSFSFQEFSQRYAAVTEVVEYEPRRQDVTNRQNSIDDLSEDDKVWWAVWQHQIHHTCQDVYQQALDRGIAKECARMLLPMTTKTRLYMNGNVRSWITYLLLRLEKGTQLEHRQIAENIWRLFYINFPTISAALISVYPEVFYGID